MDTYILAPHTGNNFAVLQLALSQFPAIAEEKRVKCVFKRSANDLVDGLQLLVPFAPMPYIYLCATVPPDNEQLAQLLEELDSYELFSISTQPFETYWL